MTIDPADAERLGVPERLDFQLGRWSLKALDALETQAGYTIDELNAAVFVEPGTRRSPKAMLAFVWAVLYSNGHRVKWDDFDLPGSAVRLELDPPAGEDSSEAAAAAPEPATAAA